MNITLFDLATVVEALTEYVENLTEDPKAKVELHALREAITKSLDEYDHGATRQ